jgi:hypothetical protein
LSVPQDASQLLFPWATCPLGKPCLLSHVAISRSDGKAEREGTLPDRVKGVVVAPRYVCIAECRFYLEERMQLPLFNRHA